MLLNQAEQKVQNRLSPSFRDNNNQLPLADKYFQSTSDLNCAVNNQSYLNENFMNKNTAAAVPMGSKGQQVTMSFSDFSSQESFDFTPQLRKPDNNEQQENSIFYNK